MDCTGRGTRTCSAGLLGLMLATAVLLAIVLLDGQPASAQAEPGSEPSYGELGSDLALEGGNPGDSLAAPAPLTGTETPQEAQDVAGDVLRELKEPLDTTVLAKLADARSVPDRSGGGGPAGQGTDPTPDLAQVTVEKQRTRDDGLAFDHDGPQDSGSPPTSGEDGIVVASGMSGGDQRAGDAAQVAQAATGATTQYQQETRPVTVTVTPARLVRNETQPRVEIIHGDVHFDVARNRTKLADEPPFGDPLAEEHPNMYRVEIDLPTGVKTPLRVSPESVRYAGAEWTPAWYKGERGRGYASVGGGPDVQVEIPDSREQPKQPQLLARYEVDDTRTPAGTPVRTEVIPLMPWGKGDAQLTEAKVTVAEAAGGTPRTLTRGVNRDFVWLAYNTPHVVTVDQPTPDFLHKGEAWLVDKVTVTDAYGDSRPIATQTSDNGEQVSFEWTPRPDDHLRITHKLAPAATLGVWYRRLNREYWGLDRDRFGGWLPGGSP
jgi:hypothetical protein